MKIYAISRNYQPLVDVDFSGNFFSIMLGNKPISKKSVSIHDLQATFNASTKAGPLIVCDNKEDALILVSLFLKHHNASETDIENDVKLLATPVIYAINIDEAALPKQTTLTADDIADYAIQSTVPLYSDLEHTNKAAIYAEQLEKIPTPVSIRKVSGLELARVVRADYANAEGTRMVSINLTSAAESLGLFARFSNMFVSADINLSPESRQTLG